MSTSKTQRSHLMYFITLRPVSVEDVSYTAFKQVLVDLKPKKVLLVRHYPDDQETGKHWHASILLTKPLRQDHLRKRFKQVFHADTATQPKVALNLKSSHNFPITLAYCFHTNSCKIKLNIGISTGSIETAMTEGHRYELSNLNTSIRREWIHVPANNLVVFILSYCRRYKIDLNKHFSDLHKLMIDDHINIYPYLLDKGSHGPTPWLEAMCLARGE